MKNNYRHFLCAAVASAMLAGAAQAGEMTKEVIAPLPEPEPWWSAELAVGYDSLYMFRGVKFAENLVYSDLSFSAFDFTLGAWYANSATQTQYDELNIYLDYTYASDFGVDLSVGVIYFNFPFDGGSDTWELYAGLGTDLGFVSPSLFFYYDVDAIDGGYLEFALESSYPLTDAISLDPYALISYDFGYNSGGNDLNHVEFGAALSIALSDNISLAPYVAVSIPLDAIDDSQDTEVWGGASVAFSF
ncbi:MAG: hypothetical protein ACFCU3_01890 [Verrucomicrobiales bacterium]